MVEIFTKDRFERALPMSRRPSLSPTVTSPLWKPLGIVNGEYSYILTIAEKPQFGILIRSSVRANGQSARAGEDSIRCWLISLADKKPWGSKVSKWVTRVPGWEGRLIDTLRKLYKMALAIKDCEFCSQPMKVFRVKRDGPNHGKVFLKCHCALGHLEPPKFMEIL